MTNKFYMGFNDNKENRIKFYQFLADRFTKNPEMETSVLMSEAADKLVEKFGMNWEEIEALEI